MQSSVHVSTLISQFIWPLFLPLGVHTFSLYLCVSTSAVQIGSSVLFSQIPHMRINIPYLLFSCPQILFNKYFMSLKKAFFFPSVTQSCISWGSSPFSTKRSSVPSSLGGCSGPEHSTRMVTGRQGRHGICVGLTECLRACDGDTQDSMFSVIFNWGWLKFWGNWEPQNELEDETRAGEGRAERKKETESWRRHGSPWQPGLQPLWLLQFRNKLCFLLNTVWAGISVIYNE